MSKPHIEVKYKNWRGEIAIREVVPVDILYLKSGTEYHPHPGWFMVCFDIEKQRTRTYSLADCDFRMTRTLESAWNAVREFHIAFGHPAPEKPTAQTAIYHNNGRRADWIAEEIRELLDAKDLTEIADAYLDVIYFALGGLVEIGIEPSEIFDMVQSANMAKLFPDGKPHYNESGKVIKPEGWQSPDEKIKAHIQGLME